MTPREFLQTVVPGGYRNVRCKGCGEVRQFHRHDLALPRWKAAHVCPERPTPEPETAA